MLGQYVYVTPKKRYVPIFCLGRFNSFLEREGRGAGTPQKTPLPLRKQCNIVIYSSKIHISIVGLLQKQPFRPSPASACHFFVHARIKSGCLQNYHTAVFNHMSWESSKVHQYQYWKFGYNINLSYTEISHRKPDE